MTLQVSKATLQASLQAVAKQTEQSRSNRNDEVTTQTHSSAPNGAVLQLTHIIRGRAELAALQLASSRLMGDISGVQALQEGVREIHSIVQQLGELSGQALHMNDSYAIARLEREIERLGRRIYQVLATHTPGMGSRLGDGAEEPGQDRSPAELFAVAILSDVRQTFDRLDVSSPAKAEESVHELDTLAVKLLDYSRDLDETRDMLLAANEESARKTGPQPEDAARLLAHIHDAMLSRPDTASLAQANLMRGSLRVQAVR